MFERDTWVDLMYFPMGDVPDDDDDDDELIQLIWINCLSLCGSTLI